MSEMLQIALVGPASALAQKADVQPIVDYLTRRGLGVHYQADVYTALPAAQRADIFLSFLLDPTIDVIWAVRGGEGSADIIPYLEEAQSRIRALKPKRIIGFSDISALLLYFFKKYHWPVIHGPVALQLISTRINEQTKHDILSALQADVPATFQNLIPLNQHARTSCVITASVMVSNLTLLALSVSDVWQIDFKDQILLLEDLNEAGYRIIRTLKYFKRIGLLTGIKALIYGDFNCATIGHAPEEQATQAKSIATALHEFAQMMEVPVLMSTEFGHGYINKPIRLGACARLTLGSSATLSVEGEI